MVYSITMFVNGYLVTFIIVSTNTLINAMQWLASGLARANLIHNGLFLSSLCLREGARSEGATWAVSGSGVPPYRDA